MNDLIKLKLVTEDEAECLHRLQVEAFMPLYEKYQDDDTSPAKESLKRVTEKIIDTNTLEGIVNPYLPKTGWGWSVDPDGLMLALQDLYDRYQKPLFISENGLGAIDTVEEGNVINDDYRIDYMRKHVQAMQRAIEKGVDLFGYTMWGPIDIVSNGTGQMSKRYGIIYVDLDDEGNGTGNRYLKKSYNWYKTVIGTNGKDLGIE